MALGAGVDFKICFQIAHTERKKQIVHGEWEKFHFSCADPSVLDEDLCCICVELRFELSCTLRIAF